MGHRTAARLPGRIGAAPQECTGGTGLATRPADGGTAPTAPTALVTLTCCCSPASSGAGLSREEQSPDGMPAHQGQVGKADVMVDAGFIIEGQHCHKKPSEKNDGQPRHDTPTSGSVGEDAAPSKPLARPRRAPASISNLRVCSLSESLSNARSLLPALEEANKVAEGKREPAIQAENRAFETSIPSLGWQQERYSLTRRSCLFSCVRIRLACGA